MVGKLVVASKVAVLGRVAVIGRGWSKVAASEVGGEGRKREEIEKFNITSVNTITWCRSFNGLGGQLRDNEGGGASRGARHPPLSPFAPRTRRQDPTACLVLSRLHTHPSWPRAQAW